MRTPADIFEQWEREHGVGGQEMADHVARIQDAIERELCVEEVPPGSRGRSNLLARQGADALGYESHYMRRYIKGCLGHGQCLQGCREDRKQSLNRNYIPEVLSRGGEVLSCAPAERILLSGRRAVGVSGRFRHPQTREKGAPFVVRARKAVLVAASVVHTPRLLAASGVRSPMLGKGFRAHPGTPVFGVYDEPVDMNTGATQGWAIAMWVQACRAEAVGEVKTLFGKPAVYYTLGRDDMLRFREAMHLIARTHVAAGAKAVLPAIHGMPYKLEPDQIDLLKEAPLDPRCYVAILSHLFGGCVMGKDPARSVCDGKGRVHGYEGLAVVDAAAIPTNLGVNPQHTIMALAWRWSEQLLEEG